MIKYNGYTFSDHSNVEVSMELVYDEAGRVVTGKRYMITVSALVAPGPEFADPPAEPPVCELNTNTAMEDIRKRLSASGKSLVMTEIGFGDPIEINDSAGGEKDIDSGPKSEVVSWLPIGHENAAEIVWRCSTTVSPCDDDTFIGLRSLNYSIGFSINRKGFTTKRVSGHLTVAQSNYDGKSTASADDFRDSIVVDRMANSHREQDFSLSADKSRLDFTITDQEIESPNAYPAGVVAISAPTRLRIPYPNPNAVVSHASFQVKMELEATQPRTRAWELFQSLFGLRIQEYKAANITIIVTDFSMEEDWFSHDYSFSIQYQIATDFTQMLEKSTFFKAYPVAWLDWSTSVSLAQSQRGLGQLKHERTEDNDKLTTLCNQDPTTVDVQGTEYFRDVGTIGSLCNDPPPPEYSWIKFDPSLIEAPQYETSYGSTYGEVTTTTQTFEYDDVTPKPLTNVDTSNIEQTLAQGAPKQIWIWSGTAERVGYPIPAMGKLTVNGKAAKVIGQPRVLYKQKGYLFCQPLYEVAWSIALIVLESSSTVTPNEGDPPTNNDFEEDE